MQTKRVARRKHSAGFRAEVLQACRQAGAEFIAVQMPQPAVMAASTDIRIEVRRGVSTVTVNWPLQGASECAAWLRQWLR